MLHPKKIRAPISERFHNLHLHMPSIPKVEYEAAILPPLRIIQRMELTTEQRFELEKKAERLIHQINRFYGETESKRNPDELERIRLELVKLAISHPQKKQMQ